MDYSSVIDYLFSQLANYQKTGATAYKPGLGNIKNLLQELANPERGQKFIHIAGTNGKGSVSHILASALIENGYKVGLFTSPHIKDFRERIKINGKLIQKQSVVDFVNTNKEIITELNPSFFEICTAMAFQIFKEEECDVSIIETGLGGRLDSTNVITPEISIITNISLDHVGFLGDNIKSIAKEKAGIIKAGVPVVVGEYVDETHQVFKTVAQKVKSKLILAPKLSNIKTDLIGQFQIENISTALATLKELKQNGFYLDDSKTNIALTRIKRNTNFIGRLEQIKESPRVFLDASHNEGGIKKLFSELSLIPHNKLHCIYATSSDKDLETIFKVFPKNAKYYFTQFDSDRSMKIDVLESYGKEFVLDYKTYASGLQALSGAELSAGNNDLIIVFGSFFLLEKII